MSIYATRDDAIALYDEVYVNTSVTRDDEPDLAAFDEALQAASDEVDGYLGGRYDLPLPTPFPRSIIRHVIDMAIYIASSDAGTYTDEKRKRYEDALDWLKLVALGTVILPPPEGAPDPTDVDLPVLAAEERLFTRTRMNGL